jgi:cell fate (sporulation/competence/biofilm development) regulator YmcA (YheA/YmcA/DUF963 family)
MPLNRKTLRRMILEEIEKVSELSEFSESRSGKNFIKEGQKIQAAGKKIHELGSDQTGAARRTIQEVGKFVHNLGEALSNINELNESGEVSKLPTVAEYKKMIKDINKLGS